MYHQISQILVYLTLASFALVIYVLKFLYIWLSDSEFISVGNACQICGAFFNDIHREKLNFRSSPPETFLGKGVLKICSKFSTRIYQNQILAASDLFDRFTQSIKVLMYKLIQQVDRKWTCVLSTRETDLTAKFEFVFVLTQKSASL